GALAEAMVDQALAAVRVHGAEHVSLRSIAQALEVSPSAAYNHFADREALLGAVGSCGLAALDERMARSLAAHTEDSAEGAVARFAGLGRAYLTFAVEETHLFQLTFGPLCAKAHAGADDSGPSRKLAAALDELDRRGLLKPGIREGLDMVIWAATHGFANLLVEGYASGDDIDAFMAGIERIVLASGSPS
ncbi:MAG: TetR/AcrR family transcriptional regulator, partial [Actinomycetota bacterium]